MESTFDVNLYDGTHQVDLYTNLSPLAIERQREVYRFILNMRSNSNTIHKMFEWTFEPIDHQTNKQTNKQIIEQTYATPEDSQYAHIHPVFRTI